MKCFCSTKLQKSNWSRQKILCLFSMLAALLISAVGQAMAQGDPIVIMQTTKGPIVIRVFAGMVPTTCQSFLDLVSRGYYNGKIFHRVENWVVQGGCPFGNGQGSFVDPATGQTRYLPLEINPNLHHNAAGVVAMARGSNRNSASCQFYILKKPMPQLDGQYAVFGGVVQGMNTVYNIGIGDRILEARIAGGPQRSSTSETEADSSSSSSSTEPPAGQTGGQSGF
jgi:peptidyl-prolyl cis-trans isomerase B (cyclophilin B)